jgi:subtilisin family serine protease
VALQLAVACGLLSALAAASPAEPLPTRVAAQPSGLPTRLAAVAELAQHSGAPRALQAARASGNAVLNGRVAVELESQPGSTADALAAVRQVGGRVLHRYRKRATVLLPPSALSQVAAAGGVAAVRERSRPFLDGVAGEGVAITGAPAWHAAGWTGAGVKVAVIDGGFAGYRRQQASGKLPASVETVDFCPVERYEGSDHGTAVAEIVHEMAPAAQLTLICIDDGVALGDALAYAKANRIRIVNHSAAWFNTWRGDGTGPPETPDGIAAAARDAGILWVNSAGNYGRAHWAGRFNEAGFGRHEFAPGDPGNSFMATPRVETCVFLRWDDWPVSSEDLDLFVYRDRGHAPIAASIEEQSGLSEPREQICFSFDGTAPESFSVEIQRKSGSGRPNLDVFVPGARLEYQTAPGSIGEPASSPAAMAVGAACWQNGALEPYSSQGPTIDGRRKPEITAPDSVSSGTYGTFAACGEHAGFPGTSASSPHVAGAAALVKQARPSWTETQIRGFLEQRAADAGARGRDNQYGAGHLALGKALRRAAKRLALQVPRTLALPAIQGIAAPGRTVRATLGLWAGTAPFRYTVTWLKCTIDGLRCAKLGKPGRTYEVSTTDGDATIRFAVTVTNSAGSRTAVSRPTDPVPGVFSSEPGDALVMFSFATTPAPRAGGLLEARAVVFHVDGTQVLGGTARCAAASGSTKLPLVRHGWAGANALCAWRVPVKLAGKRVTGALTVTAAGFSTRQAFAVRVSR